MSRTYELYSINGALITYTCKCMLGVNMSINKNFSAALYINNISKVFRTVDDYFLKDPTPMLDVMNSFYDKTDIELTVIPITTKEMLERI